MPISALHGNGVFALRRHQLGAVNLEQWLAFANRLSGHVDKQALDITFELGRYGDHAALVGLDAARGAHQSVERSELGRLGAHTELLHLVGADLHLLGGHGFFVGATGIDRDVVHAHGVLLGGG
jgi:hypothetical protein